MKIKTYLLMAGGLCLVAPSGAVEAAPKPPKACDIKKARPANRFGSYLVQKPEVQLQPVESQESYLLLEPDDSISAPTRGQKPRKRKQSSIQSNNESCCTSWPVEF
jgi:hypothetical protein